MSANFILFSQLNILPSKLLHVTTVWHEIFGSDQEQYKLYKSYESDTHSILMITNLKEPSDVFLEIQNDKWLMFEKKVRENLSSDWRHQVLTLEESVKQLSSALPASPFIQLRHIEVPLCVYSQYLKWRRDTIFRHVQQQAKIDFFLSYHSVLSAEPGVMFLSGFSCEPADYLNLFNNDEYMKIVKEAGDKYISGGEKGLYTVLYQQSTH